MTIWNRRAFLKISALSWSAMALGLEAPRESFLIGDTGLARLWRSGMAGGAREYPLPFLPHAFCANPFQPHIVFTTEKDGRHAAVVDLRSGDVKLLEPRAGRLFSGHSVWHPNGLWIFATQRTEATGEGQVVAFSTSNWLIRGEYPSGGGFPHDLHFEHSSPWLVVLNSRGVGLKESSSLAWVNPQNGQIEKRRALGHAGGVYNHFVQRADHSVILTGSSEAGRHGHSLRPLLALASGDGAMRSFRPGAGSSWSGEALNVAVHEKRGLIAATFPRSGSLHVWNLVTGEHLRSLAVREPRGLIASLVCCGGGAGFLVSSAVDRQWIALDDGFEKLHRVKATAAGCGSHAIRITAAV